MWRLSPFFIALFASQFHASLALALPTVECVARETNAGIDAEKAKAANSRHVQTVFALRDVFEPLIKRVHGKAIKLDRRAVRAELREIVSTKALVHMNNYASVPPKETPDLALREFKKLNRSIVENAQPTSNGQFGDHWNSTFSERYKGYMVQLPKTPDDPDWAYFASSATGNVWHASITPIGEYGTSFGRSLLLTTSILRRAAVAELKADAPEIFAKHRALLEEQTARGYTDLEKGPVMALAEGIVTVNQVVNLLLANKLPGYPNYRDAMRRLILPTSAEKPNGFIAEFTLRLPLAVVGPATFGGRHVRNAINVTESSIDIDPKFMAALKHVHGVHLGQLQRHADNPTPGSGHGSRCPVAHTKGSCDPKSGIQYTAEAFLHVFEMVDNALNPPQ